MYNIHIHTHTRVEKKREKTNASYKYCFEKCNIKLFSLKFFVYHFYDQFYITIIVAFSVRTVYFFSFLYFEIPNITPKLFFFKLACQTAQNCIFKNTLNIS